MFEVEIVMQTSNSQARKRARVIVVASVDKEQLFMLKKNPVDLTVAGFPANSTAVFTSVCSLLGNFHGLLSCLVWLFKNHLESLPDCQNAFCT